jgi:flagellar export protein FliJ
MANNFDTLIRFHQWQVDEVRRKLGDLLRLIGDLEEQAAALEVELSEEQRIATAAPEQAGFLYGAYAHGVIERREGLAAAIAKTEEEATEVREEVRKAYRELKKYEITQDNRQRREVAERDRVVQMELDEVALQSYRQKRE